MTFKEALDHAASLKGWTEEEQRDVLLEYLEEIRRQYVPAVKSTWEVSFENFIKKRMKKEPKPRKKS